MSTLLQAANDVSLKKKAQLFFVLNFLLTMIAAAGLLYVFFKHSGETSKIIHASLCVILFFFVECSNCRHDVFQKQYYKTPG